MSCQTQWGQKCVFVPNVSAGTKLFLTKGQNMLHFIVAQVMGFEKSKLYSVIILEWDSGSCFIIRIGLSV